MVDWLSLLKEADDEAQEEFQRLFGSPGSGTPRELPPRLIEIARILEQKPLLIQPTLEWVKAKLAEMATAELTALYGEERVRRMQDELRQREARRPVVVEDSDATD